MGLFSAKKYPLLEQNFSARPSVCAILHEKPEKNTPYGAVIFLGNARNLAFHPKNNTPFYDVVYYFIKNTPNWVYYLLDNTINWCYLYKKQEISCFIAENNNLSVDLLFYNKNMIKSLILSYISSI